MSSSSFADRLRSPRAALLANVALLMTGAVLALAGAVDFVTGAVIVGFGAAGVVVSLLGQR